MQQDKVNYAVSEREDRVRGATTLMRMAGCNGMYWAATVWGCIGLYCTVPVVQAVKGVHVVQVVHVI